MIDRVPDLLDMLRADGYDIGVGRYLMVERLLRAMEREGSLPEDPGRWEPLIAPVVCGSPVEQERFAMHFREWRSRLDEPVGNESGKVGDSDGGPTRVTSAPEGRKRLMRYMAAGLALLLTAAGIYFGIILGGDESDGGKQTVLPPDPNVGNDDIPWIDTVRTGMAWSPVTVIHHAWEPPDLEERIAMLSSWERFYYRYHDLIRYGVPSAILLAALLGALMRHRRRLQLERRYSEAEPRLHHHLAVAKLPDLCFGPEYRAVLQAFRRYRESDVVEVNAERTVMRSIRNGGAFTLVNSRRRSAPEYLALVERVSMADHRARFHDELVRSLAANNVYLDHYYYRDDPRWCAPVGGGGGMLSLKELASYYPNHHLLMFGSGAGLLDPISGAPQRWTEGFEAWSRRAIVTPEPVADWANREAMLREIGFKVVPLTGEGLLEVASPDEPAEPPDEAGEVRGSGYPVSLLSVPERWVGIIPPDPAELRTLRLELVHYFHGMGGDGYGWLAACAVYPALHWDVVLYLGTRLVPKERFIPILGALTRLPWFRYGSMPDWFRTMLLASLPPGREDAIRGMIVEMLEGGMKAPDGTPLPFVTLGPESRAGNSPGDDQVFLSFVTGRRPGRLAMRLSPAIRRFIYRNGDARVGMRWWVPPVIGVLAAAGVYTALPDRPKIPSINPPDVPRLSASPIMGRPGDTLNLYVASLDSLSLEGISLSLLRTMWNAAGTQRVVPDGDTANMPVFVQAATSYGFTDDSIGILSRPLSIPSNCRPGDYVIELRRDTGLVGYFDFKVLKGTKQPLSVVDTPVTQGGTTLPIRQPVIPRSPVRPDTPAQATTIPKLRGKWKGLSAVIGRKYNPSSSWTNPEIPASYYQTVVEIDGSVELNLPGVTFADSKLPYSLVVRENIKSLKAMVYLKPNGTSDRSQWILLLSSDRESAAVVKPGDIKISYQLPEHADGFEFTWVISPKSSYENFGPIILRQKTGPGPDDYTPVQATAYCDVCARFGIIYRLVPRSNLEWWLQVEGDPEKIREMDGRRPELEINMTGKGGAVAASIVRINVDVVGN